MLDERAYTGPTPRNREISGRGSPSGNTHTSIYIHYTGTYYICVRDNFVYYILCRPLKLYFECVIRFPRLGRLI